ncbi:MAG TPA: hypothetical protein PLZ55_16025, partial [bacterium]|nr:hypothetical protein [bacterium]
MTQMTVVLPDGCSVESLIERASLRSPRRGPTRTPGCSRDDVTLCKGNSVTRHQRMAAWDAVPGCGIAQMQH